MSIDFSVVRTSIYDWATANIPSGMPAIYLFNNAPRPVVDYITLYISNVSQIGWDWVQDPADDTGVGNQVGDREFTVQIDAYGDDPLTVLNTLRTSLQKQSVLNTLRANGIVLANWYAINDITTLIDSRFEQRGTMEVLFRIADKYTDTPGVIDTINVDETILDPTGSTVITQTITIPP